MTAHQPCTGANAASRRPPSSSLCCCGAGGGVRSPAVSPGRIRSSVLIRNPRCRWGRPERLSRDSLRTENGIRLMGVSLGESRKTREFLVAMTFRVGTAALHVWRPAFRWWQSSWRLVRSTCSRVPVAFALRGASCRLVPSRHPDGADRLRGEGTELFAAGDRVIAGGGRLSVGEDRLSVGGGQLYGWGSDVSRWGCWPTAWCG